MACPIYPNTTIADELQLWHFLPSLAAHTLCGVSYLRPDVGGSIFPWPYTIVWLLIHFPLVIIRAVRWEKVQVLSIVVAVVSVAFCIQAYSSTARRPEEVLVWMPLTLILDAGAMLQLFWLIVEEAGFRTLVRALRQWMLKAVTGRKQRKASGNRRDDAITHSREPVADDASSVSVAAAPIPARLDLEGRVSRQEPNLNTAGAENEIELEPVAEPRCGCHRKHEEAKERNRSEDSLQESGRGLVGKAFISLLALVLFLVLLILQILGLVSAVKARQHTKDLTVEWCSPMFQGFSLAIQDGNCQFHPVKSGVNKVLGCIDLPATRQIDWLKATIMVVPVCLFFEAFDTIILVLVKSHKRWREMKMRRPWFSMFGGVLILVVMAVLGANNATNLPQGMGTVWVYRREPSLGAMTVCQGNLTSAGIRGSILGWTDGFLNSWGTLYYGG